MNSTHTQKNNLLTPAQQKHAQFHTQICLSFIGF